MLARYDELRAAGGEVVAVTFSPAERIAPYVVRHGWPCPVLADPLRRAYRRFELARGSLWRVMGPGVTLSYLKLMARGKMPQLSSIKDDIRQLGGDFVLDAQRRLVYAYASRDPADRPPAGDVIAALKQAAAKTPPGSSSV